MNTYFNISRFSAFFKSFLFENRKNMIRYASTFAGLAVLFQLLILVNFSIGSTQLLLWVITPFYLMIVPSQSLAYINNKVKGIGFYMTPASILEKTISIILYLNILVPLLMLTSLVVGDFVGQFMTQVKDFHFQTTMLYMLIHNVDNCFSVGFIFSCFLSLFILGAIFFKKGGFAKTLLLIFAVCFIISLIFNAISYLQGNPFTFDININLPDTLSYILYFSVFPCACWFGTYLTLKKRQL